MKLLYELRIIDIDQSQWTPHRPWPLRLARAIWGLLVALLTGLLLTAMHIEYTMRAVTASLLTTAEAVAGAIRVVYAAGRVAAKVAWGDLAYEMGRVLIGNRLEGCCV